MNRPMEQQPSVKLSIEAKRQKKVYVKFRDDWFVADRNAMSPRTTHFFDAIVFMNTKGLYEVAKDTHGDLDSNAFGILKLELFFDGKTLDELNKFYIHESSKDPDGPLALYREENGDLVAQFAINEYHATN